MFGVDRRGLVQLLTLKGDALVPLWSVEGNQFAARFGKVRVCCTVYIVVRGGYDALSQIKCEDSYEYLVGLRLALSLAVPRTEQLGTR